MPRRPLGPSTTKFRNPLLEGVRDEEIDQLANIACITKRNNLKIGSKSPSEHLGELAGLTAADDDVSEDAALQL